MDPKDFFKTAAFLNEQKDEHYIRTSISRSYYAVHLYISHFISNTFLGRKKFKNAPHMNVIHCLQRCDAKDIKSIGVMLLTLLQARTDADYKMSKTITPNKSQDIYDDANDLLSDFDSKVNIPANMRKFSQSSVQQAKFERILES